MSDNLTTQEIMAMSEDEIAEYVKQHSIDEMIVINTDQNQLVHGFISSEGELEYTVYEARDGGVIEEPRGVRDLLIDILDGEEGAEFFEDL